MREIEIADTFLSHLIERYPGLFKIKNQIHDAAKLLINTYRNGGKVLICGNGGSSADSDHIVGELMKSFIKKRPITDELHKKLEKEGEMGKFIAKYIEQGLPAISLSSQSSFLTAYINDVDPTLLYAQQVVALAKPEDLLWCLSTSGNSKNVVYAAVAAKAMEIPVLSLTGQNPSKLSNESTVCIQVPEKETYKIQELHLPIYHALALIVEEYFFDS